MSRLLPIAFLAFGTVALTSCGTMDSLKTGTMSGVSKVGSGFSQMGQSVGSGFGKMGESVGEGFGKVAEVTTSPFKPGLPVVEAREADLKEMPSGHDRAIAYQAEQRRRRGWWIFGGAVDFEEPTLPDDPMNAEAGLLPPLE